MSGILLLAAQVFLLTACGPEPDQKKTRNAEINSTVPLNAEESREAIGVGAGNQDERGDYPKNQANLHPDSTRRDSTRIR